MLPRAGRIALAAAEITIVSALVLATRCANWRDVFIAGGTYFTDADCYARMTRARICFEHPFTIVRHHAFENFPAGTTPHTTAPFDYAIVALAECLRPISEHPLEIAGAFVSPLIALIGGWFVWWWTRRMRFRWRLAGVLLYALSPIVVHGTEVGRPDHQSLAIVLVLVATCAQWSQRVEATRAWSVVAGAAWGLAIWISVYEPLVLFVIASACSMRARFARERWAACGVVLGCALLVERRFFIAPDLWRNQHIANWLSTIGEMSPVAVRSVTWLYWCGLFVVIAPILFVLAYRHRAQLPITVVVLLGTAFVLTALEARWAYFFVVLLAIVLPSLLDAVRNRFVAATLVAIGFAPIVYAWQQMIWPNESERAARIERQIEMRDIQQAAKAIAQQDTGSFIAPWWFSPAIAYWSRCNGVAGSSHESIDGIVDTARFYLATDDEIARAILLQHDVRWVIAYDADRTAANSATILGLPVPRSGLIFTLARTPSRAPQFVRAVYQNRTCTLFNVQNSQ